MGGYPLCCSVSRRIPCSHFALQIREGSQGTVQVCRLDVCTPLRSSLYLSSVAPFYDVYGPGPSSVHVGYLRSKVFGESVIAPSVASERLAWKLLAADVDLLSSDHPSCRMSAPSKRPSSTRPPPSSTADTSPGAGSSRLVQSQLPNDQHQASPSTPPITPPSLSDASITTPITREAFKLLVRKGPVPLALDVVSPDPLLEGGIGDYSVVPGPALGKGKFSVVYKAVRADKKNGKNIVVSKFASLCPFEPLAASFGLALPRSLQIGLALGTAPDASPFFPFHAPPVRDQSNSALPPSSPHRPTSSSRTAPPRSTASASEPRQSLRNDQD
jgi:hypothetical protein